MRVLRTGCFLVLIVSFQRIFALEIADKEVISSTINQYVEAWNDHAGAGFADNFLVDSDFINIFGMHFHGRDENQKRHDKIHDTFLKDSIFTIRDVEYRQVKADVVLAFVEWEVNVNPEKKMKGIFSHLFIKEDGNWKIAFTQNTLQGESHEKN